MEDPFYIRKEGYQLAKQKDSRLDVVEDSSLDGQMRTSRASDPQRCTELWKWQQGLAVAHSVNSLNHKDLPLASKGQNWCLTFCTGLLSGFWLLFALCELLYQDTAAKAASIMLKAALARAFPSSSATVHVPHLTCAMSCPSPSQEIVLTPVVYFAKLWHPNQGRL